MEVNDIYHARWKNREWGDQKDHCFEGLFIVLEDNKKEKWFVDSFWGIGRWDNKKYKIDEAKEKFDLTFYCNLDKIEKINKHQSQYYKESDIFVLHDQHACVENCRYYYKRKDAEKDKETIINLLKGKIREKENQIESNKRSIENYREDLEKVYNNNLEIYA